MKRPSTLPDVAIAHDYFVQDGGAERVAIELARMFPDAPIYTTFFERDRFGTRLDASRVRSWPLAGRVSPSPWFRPLLPAYLAHFSRLEVPAARLVISNSSTFARAVRPQPHAIHIAYVHSPLRFAWDVDGYLARSSFPGAARLGLRATAPFLRRWDRWAGSRPDVLVTNSDHVRRSVLAKWHRDSTVIHPPVEVARRGLSSTTEDFYLVASRLLAYKRVDLAVEACALLDRPLVVAGDGPERARLERLAGRRTRFVGHVDQEHLEELQSRARGLLVPGIEDFGMAAVEVMGVGRPVVGFAAGGLLETVVDATTGVLFESASSRGLATAIERLESLDLDPAAARRRALEFDVAAFRRRWCDFLQGVGLGGLLEAETVPAA
ncbi:MAG TPA: glycosyltransferase [Candidatus Limnocylindria bacterium]|nr:glycosyltransferase [Candidatus Limnocylindria bacterium]